MGRPRKVKAQEPVDNSTETEWKPKVTILDPRFGYSRPAPKPSGKKKRGEESEN